MDEKKVYQIGIVGGGKVGLQLFEQFMQSALTQVAFVVDINHDAPAMVAARKKKIPIFTDISDAIKSRETDLICEVTGSKKVESVLQAALSGSPTPVLSHEMAFIVLSVIEENNHFTRSRFCEEILGVRDDIQDSLGKMETLVEGVEDISSEMKILALNARIETARAGEAGITFRVVAENMTRSADSIQHMTKEIEKISHSVRQISDRIQKAAETMK
ncbi:MAG TPA: methyl-accepting chemotaxis protein [Anaerolineaceae bacterium]|nr:methyl-accepting chemotaxis protein [Anaerolineaceae bacterium]HPN53189.1 methyl-accepting chemotaxis protein [Anaerolineaceae bacterium]